ncbi:putative siderophore biosynthesis lipase/esterase [Myriangium duriaei CBS 260.36]|uniref:Siderophore biosynthesis lipase/esterase n=1 Tax=Myriangium duriaei CBS 260.36 TaxID=1168546 RepID=A0A9P4MKI8_9PEZI|nr:putative siderophore biosynthesis lipase/esterase [Myriangium duriaei CBS 260.36]
MYSKFWPKGGLPGILHHFTESLVTFEFTSGATPKPHSILFVGGLGDGLATTSYMVDMVHALDKTKWSIFSVNLTSAYQSWGLGHLDRDTDEIAKCLEYIKEYKTAKFGSSKVVLMGHSTGSQNVLHYLHRPNPHDSTTPFDPYLQHDKRLPLDGAIMQAPVSDREAVHAIIKDGLCGTSPSEMKSIVEQLEKLARDGASQSDTHDTILPLSLTSKIYPANTPVSGRRFLSLVSPQSPESPSDDDLFSSDLSDEQLAKTFGTIQQQGLLRNKLMVLISGNDQSYPKWVKKEDLLVRWQRATDANGAAKVWDEKHSGIIPNASHALSNDDQAEPRQWLCKRVLGYLQASEELWDAAGGS